MTATPPVGWVRISSTDPPITLQVRLSADRPTVDAGYGGWQEVARPRRQPLSIWQGSPGLRMTLPILLDRWSDTNQGRRDSPSIERQITQLETLALPTAADGQPPRVRLTAKGGAIPHQGKVWVVDAIAWGDALMNKAGDRARQQATLSLLEFIADVRVGVVSSACRRRSQAARVKTKAGAKAKRVVAGKGRPIPKGRRAAPRAGAEFGGGEDLLSIAARELGDADRWVEIAQLNGLRDPRAIVVGQTLRMP